MRTFQELGNMDFQDLKRLVDAAGVQLARLVVQDQYSDNYRGYFQEQVREFSALDDFWLQYCAGVLADSAIRYSVPVDPADATICESCQ